MTCGNCGNAEAYARFWNSESEGCDRCGGTRTFADTADVYFKGPYVDPHLASEQFPGPKVINTRAEKAYWLKKCNLREAGDRTHGATSFDPISHRHAMDSLQRRTK